MSLALAVEAPHLPFVVMRSRDRSRRHGASEVRDLQAVHRCRSRHGRGEWARAPSRIPSMTIPRELLAITLVFVAALAQGAMSSAPVLAR